MQAGRSRAARTTAPVRGVGGVPLALIVVSAIALVVAACGSGGGESAAPVDERAEGSGSRDEPEGLAADAPSGSALCAVLGVDEIESIVGAETVAPVATERSCRWDIGPEFVVGDNSEVSVSASDGRIQDGMTYEDTQDMTSFGSLPAYRPTAFNLLVQVADDWYLTVLVYNGHDAAGQASQETSRAAVDAITPLVVDRLQTGEAAPTTTPTTSTTSPVPQTTTAPTEGAVTLGVASAPDQVGIGAVAPTEFTTGDPLASIVRDVSWSAWGAAEATGTGRVWYSETATDLVGIVAFDLGDCQGRTAYRQVEWFAVEQGQSRGNGSQLDVCVP